MMPLLVLMVLMLILITKDVFNVLLVVKHVEKINV